MRRDSKSFAVLRVWLLVAAAVILSACSTGVRLGYEYADTLLLYTIDGYVGLTPEQEQLVKERSAALVAWHRSTQLRDYAELLETTRRKLAGPVSAADVLEFNRAVNARLAALGERAAPDLAQLALTLTPEQLTRLERKLASDNSKARRELVQFAGKEALDERVKKYAERADFWFGSVSREQLELVRSALAQRPEQRRVVDRGARAPAARAAQRAAADPEGTAGRGGRDGLAARLLHAVAEPAGSRTSPRDGAVPGDQRATGRGAHQRRDARAEGGTVATVRRLRR